MPDLDLDPLLRAGGPFVIQGDSVLLANGADAVALGALLVEDPHGDRLIKHGVRGRRDFFCGRASRSAAVASRQRDAQRGQDAGPRNPSTPFETTPVHLLSNRMNANAYEKSRALFSQPVYLNYSLRLNRLPESTPGRKFTRSRRWPPTPNNGGGDCRLIFDAVQ